MATLASPSPSPPRSMKTKRKSCARRCERCCWSFFTYFPLFMVYGLTSWAVWVEVNVSLGPKKYGLMGTTTALLGIILYLLLNWSYTVAVFTDPGSPLTQTTSAYSIVPTSDDDDDVDDDLETNVGRPLTDHGPAHASFTVKSTGEMRYCKKCHTRKPDRAHHCSTCRRCVLKMDHHCPWLATCVGFRNQKPFILFLIYVSLFCWMCFATTVTWVAAEFFGQMQNNENLFPVNCVLLAVLSGIIGLVITGFTAWHIWLASRAQTTIESLEATRYVVPIRKSTQQQRFGTGHSPEQRNYSDSMTKPEPTLGNHLRSIHANVLPGITRPEEGLETPDRSMITSDPSSSPAHSSLRQHLNSGAYHQNREFEHERARYEAYQDEVDSAKLPHAFNHGWRRNFSQLFGDRLELAWLPICNSKGDGWNWEPSKEWLEARGQLEREREARKREEAAFQQDRAETMPSFRKDAMSSSSDDDDVPLARRLGRGLPAPPPRGSSRTLLEQGTRKPVTATNGPAFGPTSNWNDLPDDFLSAPRQGGSASRSKSPGTRNARRAG